MRKKPSGRQRRRRQPAFAAIDLGTNNCRLLVARPERRGFRVVDAFSRIVRLGEGVGQSGRLSDAAMARTLAALKLCAEKMASHDLEGVRAIATQACRMAANGEAFLQQIEAETGIAFDLISPAEEAALSVKGCTDLIGTETDAVIVFDIGCGSTARARPRNWCRRRHGPPSPLAWSRWRSRRARRICHPPPLKRWPAMLKPSSARWRCPMTSVMRSPAGPAI